MMLFRTARKKGPEFSKEFSTVLGKAFAHVHEWYECNICSCIFKLKLYCMSFLYIACHFLYIKN